MSKPSPLQRVKSEYGSKENLVDQLVSKLERFDDEGADEFKVRLMRVSNKKLLRLMSVQQRFESEFVYGCAPAVFPCAGVASCARTPWA